MKKIVSLLIISIVSISIYYTFYKKEVIKDSNENVFKLSENINKDNIFKNNNSEILKELSKQASRVELEESYKEDEVAMPKELRYINNALVDMDNDLQIEALKIDSEVESKIGQFDNLDKEIVHLDEIIQKINEKENIDNEEVSQIVVSSLNKEINTVQSKVVEEKKETILNDISKTIQTLENIDIVQE